MSLFQVELAYEQNSSKAELLLLIVEVVKTIVFLFVIFCELGLFIIWAYFNNYGFIVIVINSCKFIEFSFNLRYFYVNQQIFYAYHSSIHHEST